VRCDLNMTLVERAIQIALHAHTGQPGKDGSPYVLHPLRLMSKMETDEERMVAVLHDVVEDSDFTLSDLREAGFPPRVLEAVELLTHDKETPYEEYVQRIKPHPLARKVKLADLEDNSNLRRLAKLEEKDLERVKKYHRAWVILTSP
jgi:(p)ppGpp synthase/HD superfamily hydrolase